MVGGKTKAVNRLVSSVSINLASLCFKVFLSILLTRLGVDGIIHCVGQGLHGRGSTPLSNTFLSSKQFKLSADSLV